MLHTPASHKFQEIDERFRDWEFFKLSELLEAYNNRIGKKIEKNLSAEDLVRNFFHLSPLGLKNRPVLYFVLDEILAVSTEVIFLQQTFWNNVAGEIYMHAEWGKRVLRGADRGVVLVEPDETPRNAKGEKEGRFW